MMQSLNSDVWIKGWFDGDYNDNDNPAIGQQSQLDTKATRVNIIRGRMTSIERVEGPPEGVDYLRQEVLFKGHLQSPDGQAWITPLKDLHIADWEADSTAGVLSGGGARVGRLVGWAYARVSDPRMSPSPKPNLTTLPKADGSESSPMALGHAKDDGASPEVKHLNNVAPPPSSLPADQQHGKLNTNPTPPFESVTQPLLPHPCVVCSWGRAVIVFIIVWLVCSLVWAILAIAPLLLRCFTARNALTALPANENASRFEPFVLLILGVSAFLYVAWRALLGCGDVPTAALAVLFILVPWSTRIRSCWVIGLLGWMWGLSILMTCPSQDGECRTMPNISASASQVLSDAQNKLNQIFRPDRDAQDVSGQASSADGWTRISLEEAEKRPEKLFDCTAKADRKRGTYVVYMGESALFDLNQTVLSEASEPQLTRIGKLIEKYPQSRLTVIGHADKSPHRDGPEGNLSISERRAYAVVDWLINGGYVKPEHIAAMGAGDRYPLFDMPGEFRGNRRVEVRVVCPVVNQ